MEETFAAYFERYFPDVVHGSAPIWSLIGGCDILHIQDDLLGSLDSKLDVHPEKLQESTNTSDPLPDTEVLNDYISVIKYLRGLTVARLTNEYAPYLAHVGQATLLVLETQKNMLLSDCNPNLSDPARDYYCSKLGPHVEDLHLDLSMSKADAQDTSFRALEGPPTLRIRWHFFSFFYAQIRLNYVLDSEGAFPSRKPYVRVCYEDVGLSKWCFPILFGVSFLSLIHI